VHQLSTFVAKANLNYYHTGKGKQSKTVQIQIPNLGSMKKPLMIKKKWPVLSRQKG